MQHSVKQSQWRRGDYLIATDRSRLDLEVIHSFLSTSYWAPGRSIETVQLSIDNSLPFGIYKGTRQIGFGRVVTDYATLAWVADVFVLEGFRGQGLAKWLMDVMICHPDLQGLRRWVLATKDAHSLYEKTGFTELKRPERWMERHDPKCPEASDYWKPAEPSRPGLLTREVSPAKPEDDS
jgi:GNAT superfamily N-acetyltransferase